MIISGDWNNHPLIISAKPNCLTISIEYPEDTRVFSFDFHGRMWTAIVGGISYRRGLNGNIIAKWVRPGSDIRERRWLSKAENQSILSSSHGEINKILMDIESSRLALSEKLPQSVINNFSTIAQFDLESYSADVSQYHQVYKPVGILPPDQYMAVVLQATEGCSFNTCTFCDFYKDRPFRIKKPDEFRDHAKSVREYLGAGLSLRRTIFLGDANALVTPMPRLMEMMNITNELFDVEKLGGIFVFMDGFSGDRKTAEDYHMLVKLGLDRAYIGLESGNKTLLSLLHKPGSPDDVINTVRRMKSGKLSVGVIVLLGAGGHKFARSHVKDTIDAIHKMELDADDILYFSDLVEREGMNYTQSAFQKQMRPLTPEECAEQGRAIEEKLIFSDSGGTPHISRYDIREFVY